MSLEVDALLNEIKAVYQSVEKSYCTSSLFKKSTGDAIRLRNLGNKWYRAGQDYEALNCYTQSIASASVGSEELALAYANRSAVLLRVRKYELCLLDINRALKGNYPEKFKSKLNDRKERCLTEIKSENESKNNVTTNSQNLNDIFLPSISKTTQIRGNESDPDELINDFTKFIGPQLEHPSSLYTSRKLTPEFNNKGGKCMTASSDVEPGINLRLLNTSRQNPRKLRKTGYVHKQKIGEIVSVEEIFSSLSIVEQEYENCSYCFVKFPALIPCHSCTREVYCGERCRKRAFDSYHRTECKIWSLCLNEKLNTYELLGLRSFLIGTDQGVQLRTMTRIINLNVFEKDTTLSEETYRNDYLSVLHSYRYRTLRQPNREMILKAVKVISVLKRESFFEHNNDEDGVLDTFCKTELFATLLLLNNFATVELNNFVISEITSLNNSVCDENRLGFAVCPLHNVVNHSCDPNVSDFVRGREHVLFALRPIKRGEQVFLSYGVSFSMNSISERVKKLSVYGFTCRCEACTYKWPLLKELRGRRTKFLTRNKKVIEDIRKMYEIVFCEETRTIETFKNAIQLRKMLYGNVKPPSLMMILCECLIHGFMKSLGAGFTDLTK